MTVILGLLEAIGLALACIALAGLLGKIAGFFSAYKDR